MLIHVDTDIGGDPDDAAAIAMLAGIDGVKIAGVTTVFDPAGIRAGMAAWLVSRLRLGAVPVAAGAHDSLTAPAAWTIDQHAWAGPIQPMAGDPSAALALIRSSVERGAVLVGIGPWTNIAAAERRWPGLLRDAKVVLMGGWVRPLDGGYPQWTASRDYNVAADTVAARLVLDACEPTLVTIAATVKATLRETHCERLRATGWLGMMLAEQALAYARRHDRPALVREHPALPHDLLNFHHDPLTCAIAVGWAEAPAERERLRVIAEDGGLRLEPSRDEGDVTACVVTDCDGDGFDAFWLQAIESAALRCD